MKKLAKKEQHALKKVLDKFEQEIIIGAGLINTSGAFANTKYVDHDQMWINIEVRWGIQNGDENITHTEKWRLVRKDLTRFINNLITLKEVVRCIEIN